MSQEQNVLEVTGKDIESAIEEGLAKLGLSRSDVIVDIVEEGSRGFLGLGSKESVVRLTPLVPMRRPDQPKAAEPPAPPAQPKPAPPQQPAAAKPAPPQAAPSTPAAPAEEEDEGDLEADAEAVKGIVDQLLAKMDVAGDVTVTVSDPDSMTGKRFLAVNIEGDDVSAPIGPRGEALTSLQYVLRLMSGHQLRKRVNILLDVANYRERRRQALARLATRMAEKVTSKNRPVTLEPMPPFERRVIHMTLRDEGNVYTQSIGNGDQRRVRIYPKRN